MGGTRQPAGRSWRWWATRLFFVASVFACAPQAEAQTRLGLSGSGGSGPTLVGVDLELQLHDRLVLGFGPLVGTERVEIGVRTGLDTYVYGQPFRGAYVRSELATRVLLDVDRSVRDASIMGSILLGATWSLDSGSSFGGGLGIRADWRVYGQVRRVQLDVVLQLNWGWVF